MKRVALGVLLFCSVSVTASEKADFTLKWREESVTEELNKTARQWQKNRPIGSRHQQDVWPHKHPHERTDMLGRIHRSDRMRFIDPTFSTFNSDGGGRLVE